MRNIAKYTKKTCKNFQKHEKSKTLKLLLKGGEIMSLSKVREYQSSEDVGGLISLLEDSDAEIRYKSAEALGFVGNSQIELLHESLESENPLVRWGCILCTWWG